MCVDCDLMGNNCKDQQDIKNPFEDIAKEVAELMCSDRSCSTYPFGFRKGCMGDTTIPFGESVCVEGQYIKATIIEAIIFAGPRIIAKFG